MDRIIVTRRWTIYKCLCLAIYMFEGIVSLSALTENISMTTI